MTEESKTVTVQALCGNCVFWKHVETPGPVTIGAPRRGNCFAMPPTPVAIFAADMRSVRGQVNIRSAPNENETCGMFSPSQAAVDSAAAGG